MIAAPHMKGQIAPHAPKSQQNKKAPTKPAADKINNGPRGIPLHMDTYPRPLKPANVGSSLACDISATPNRPSPLTTNDDATGQRYIHKALQNVSPLLFVQQGHDHQINQINEDNDA